MQTCNMDERTNKEIITDDINKLWDKNNYGAIGGFDSYSFKDDVIEYALAMYEANL